MNKWLVLFATVMIAFVFAYTLPTTYANPTTSNICVSCGLAVIALIGLYVYYKSCQTKEKTKMKVGGNTYTPVD